MNRIDRLNQQLEQLKRRRSQYLRESRYLELQKLDNDIRTLEDKIEESRYYASQPIRQLISKEEAINSGLIACIIECHLAADFLTDCCYNLKQILSRHGLVAKSLVPEMDEIRIISDRIASQLCTYGNDNLTSLMTDNDTLLSALHKKTLSYIEQRSTKRNNK